MAKSDLDLSGVQAKPIEIIKPELKVKMEPVQIPEDLMKPKEKSLTWQSVLTLIIVAVVRAIISIWFDDETTNKAIEILTHILEAVGVISAGTALWGVRRSAGDIR